MSEHDHEHENGHHAHGEESERDLHDEFKRLHTIDVAGEMMVGLVTIGYQKLGLTEQTRDLRNLDDARLAIELLRAALSAVEGEAGVEQFKDFRSTLAQMQLGYAEAARGEGSAPAGGEKAETAAAAATEKAETAGAEKAETAVRADDGDDDDDDDDEAGAHKADD